jgi:hypothetical protein
VIQGTTYGPTNGTNPQEIVVTEDWDVANMNQWDNGTGGYAEAVLQPVVRDLSILGKVDVAGYADTDGMTSDIINSNTPGTWNRLFPHGDAIDFNATTSKLENTEADVLNNSKKVTVCCWINPDGPGEGNFGYLFVLDEDVANEAFYILHGPDNNLHIVKGAGPMGTEGHWTIPITDGVWSGICIRLDFSGNNPPTARLNYKKAPVTQVTAPVGIDDDPDDGYCVGNRSDQTLTWDGRIAQVQVFNDILTDSEADSALAAPGSVLAARRLWLPMTNETDTQDDDNQGTDFDGTGTNLVSALPKQFHDRETALTMRASGPLVEDVSFFHIAGTCLDLRRDGNVLAGAIQPFDRQFATLRDLTVYRSYRGFVINTIDTEVGNLEGQYLRDWGVKVPAGAAKFMGTVHMSGISSGVAPASYGTAVWLEPNAGPSWGGTWYCESSDVGMRIDSSGNKLTNFYSHSCTFRNLWIGGRRNSVVNFEIDVKDGVTETWGHEGVLIANQSNMLSNGTIGGGAPVPGGEIAVRIKNGTRQVIRDVDFVGTTGSSAPLISVESNFFAPLNNSIIVAKCVNAGTFLDLHPIYTTGTVRQGGTSSQILLAASQVFLDDELNGMTVTITGGTGATQSRTITDYTRSTNTALVSPTWTTNPSNTSTYEIRSGIGGGNDISLTTAGNVTKRINLPPTWDESNRIAVDGLRLRGSITGVSAANPAVITSPGHGLAAGDKITIAGVVGEPGVNSAPGQVHSVSNVTTDTFTVPIDTTGGSSYESRTGWWGDWAAR